MDSKILFKILSLDSLIGFLDFTERVFIRSYDGSSKIKSIKIVKAYDWIVKENWEPPKMKYKDDRLLYFYDPDSDTWLTDEYYLKLYPEYKEELIKIKNL